MNFLAVDPGTRACGVALFQNDALVAAGLVKNPVAKGDDAFALAAMATAVAAWASMQGVGWSETVVERMQSYSAQHQKGDQNDLISLSLLAGMMRPTWLVLPSQWKGQVPKPKTKKETYIVEARVRARLLPSELAVIPENTGPAWDVIDAIGIGLYHCHRFNRTRVIAR